MPRHIKRFAETEPEKRRELIEELSRELQHPSLVGQPIILEDVTPETGSIRTHVIWDRWTECADASRTGIILDAYERVLGEEYRKRISLALGITPPEAVEMGFMPYSVTTARQAEPVAVEEYRKAMQEMGAVQVPGKDGPQLRFPTLEEAESASKYLEKRLPKTKWVIVQELPQLEWS